MLGNGNEECEADEKWAREMTDFRVKFSLATLDNIEELKEFLLHNFYPDEPISRCIGIANGNGWVDNYVRYLADKLWIVDPITKNSDTTPCSVIARSLAEDCIVGCKLGTIYSKDGYNKEDSFPNFLGDLPSSIGVPLS